MNRARGGSWGRRLKWAALLYVVLCQAAMPVSTALAFENQPPVITYFSCGNLMDNWWIFYGTVEDENPGYCMITFGGCMEGYLCGVNYDGTFCMAMWLDDTQHGPVTAVTRDDHNVESNVAEDIVWNYNF